MFVTACGAWKVSKNARLCGFYRRVYVESRNAVGGVLSV